ILSSLVSGWRSARPLPTKELERCRRILSNYSAQTGTSDTFSAVSFRPEPQGAHVAALEVFYCSWNHTKEKLSIRRSLIVQCSWQLKIGSSRVTMSHCTRREESVGTTLTRIRE